VLHILGWAILGLVIGLAAGLFRPTRLPIMLLLCVAGALFGGFVSWIFWDFPAGVVTLDELLSTPALISDCLAAFGALTALSLTAEALATGAAMRETTNRGTP